MFPDTQAPADAENDEPVGLDIDDLAAIQAIMDDPLKPWRPLNVKIDPALGQAIAEDPEFDYP